MGTQTIEDLNKRMNKIIMTALVLAASASLFTAGAANKKDKKKGKKVAPIELKTSADSLSYAAGINAYLLCV